MDKETLSGRMVFIEILSVSRVLTESMLNQMPLSIGMSEGGILTVTCFASDNDMEMDVVAMKYYCDSDASVHCHHWLVGVIPNEWVEANASTSKTAMPFYKAEGRRFPKTIGSVDPKDYAEIGG